MKNVTAVLRLKFSRFISILRVLQSGPDYTYCPICKKKTIFYEEGSFHREKDRCARCGSIPRWRALFHILETTTSDWRQLKIHESSPYGAVSKLLKRQCQSCTQTHFFPELELGSEKNGYQCENLEQQTFKDESFDLVITQDVLEHVADPQAVFHEIHRTLKPGGKHIFTVPCDNGAVTQSRVRFEGNNAINLKEPQYHGNPIDSEGSLVITDWGDDICELIEQWTGMETEAVEYEESLKTHDGEKIEVFISLKS